MSKQKIHIDLIDLDRQLARLRRRAGRLERMAEHGTEPHVAWSSVLDEALELVAFISRCPSRDVCDLAIKLNATVWFLDKTDAVVDATGVRQLHAIVRDARRLSRVRTIVVPKP